MPKKSKPSKSEKPAAPKSAKPVKGGILVIVESPTKEKTISRFLKNRGVVRSSFGHVRDLPARKMGVEIKDGFKPDYVVLPKAKKIIAELKTLASKAARVYLATDPDREGESISWHLSEILKLGPEKLGRITFHEITPEAIEEAVASPHPIDMNLVQAQQARRVLDRLVGYELSPLLWEKIRRGLSAGRVQSAVTRLITEREQEIKNFKSESFWTISAVLEKPGHAPAFETKLTIWKGEKIETVTTFDLFDEPYRVRTTSLRSNADVEAVTSAASKGDFRVSEIQKKETRRRPAPPFSTALLQQTASRRLGFVAERTMRVAQSLYEGVDLGDGQAVGLITYMRTDSFNIAASAAQAASKFISERFGPAYLPAKPPVYQSKSRGAQEAHEAIRPTDPRRAPEDVKGFLTLEQAKLYELIWVRFMASQMADAVYDTVSVDVEGAEAVFHASGSRVKFDGFLRAENAAARSQDEAAEDEEDGDAEHPMNLPPLERGDRLTLVKLSPEEHQSSPPPRYNEAKLIQSMERHGIGRPSTYAPTIKTIIDRGYVRRNPKDRALTPTDLGVLVTEKLKTHFPDVVSLTYTADVEERLDKVAEGQAEWADVVRDFYGPFSKQLTAAQTDMEVSRVEPQKSDEKCPICGSPMLVRESRFGKYLSCSTFPKCRGKIQLTAEGQKLAPEPTNETCEVCGRPMVIRTGRKGKFLACSGYPECKNTYSLDAEGKKIEGSRPLLTDRPCRKCQSPMWLRKGKRGYFLACSAFPKCRNLLPVSMEEGERLKAEAERKGKKGKETEKNEG